MPYARTSTAPRASRRQGASPVLALARKHDPALTEDAAHVALATGAPSRHFRGHCHERVKRPAAALKQIDALIRHFTARCIRIERRATRA